MKKLIYISFGILSKNQNFSYTSCHPPSLLTWLTRLLNLNVTASASWISPLNQKVLAEPLTSVLSTLIIKNASGHYFSGFYLEKAYSCRYFYHSLGFLGMLKFSCQHLWKEDYIWRLRKLTFIYKKAILEEAQSSQSETWLQILCESLKIITMGKLPDPLGLHLGNRDNDDCLAHMKVVGG